MKERPIPFTGPEVLAVLEGRKTQARRPIKPQPSVVEGGTAFFVGHGQGGPGSLDRIIRCPFGQPGDRLWVRETFSRRDDTRIVAYRADGECGAWLDDGDGERIWNRHGGIIEVPGSGGPSWGLANYGGRWRPSIHMPRWASRITLEVTRVRVERVQEISEEDAKAEGTLLLVEGVIVPGSVPPERVALTHRDFFQDSWDRTYAKRGSWWASNPWVWVVEFKRIEP